MPGWRPRTEEGPGTLDLDEVKGLRGRQWLASPGLGAMESIWRCTKPGKLGMDKEAHFLHTASMLLAVLAKHTILEVV